MKIYSFVIMGLFLLCVSEAAAERARRPGAAELIQALELIDQDRCDAAIPLLRRAFDLGDLRNALWNLGECHALLSQPQQAIEAYERYMSHNRTGPADRRAAQQAIDRQRATLARISIEGNVAGAAIRVDGLDAGRLPGVVEVGAGTHVVEVASPGFEPWQQRFTIGPDEELRFTATLARLPGTLSLVSSPPHAEVRIDDEAVGASPWEGQLPAGIYDLEIRLDGFRTDARRVSVEANEQTAVRVTLVHEEGTVAVGSTAPDSTLYVDGQQRGTAPFAPLTLAPGQHELEVRAPRHASWEGVVDVVDQQTTRVEVDMATTRGAHPAWFWSMLSLSVACIGTGVLLYGLGRGYDDTASAAVDAISGESSLLSMAANRQAGADAIDRRNSFYAPSIALIFTSLLTGIATLVLAFRTRFRAPRSEARITFSDPTATLIGNVLAQEDE